MKMQKPDESRSERLARIRAARGSTERDAAVDAAVKALADRKEREARAAAQFEAADREFTRRFNRADLRTQAAMLANEFKDDNPLRDLLLQAARTLPKGVR